MTEESLASTHKSSKLLIFKGGAPPIKVGKRYVWSRVQNIGVLLGEGQLALTYFHFFNIKSEKAEELSYLLNIFLHLNKGFNAENPT